MKKHPTSKSTQITRLPLAISAAFLLSFLPNLSASAEELLQVFLQGASAAEIGDLVVKHGGSVTHSLHIIDAVGAKLTGKQLADVLESPLVSRFIDDLADSDVPGKPEEEEDAPPCRVRGHIELDFVENGLSWRLYNKYEKPAALSSLTLDWPDELGSIQSLSIGDTKIPPRLFANTKESKLALEFQGKDQPIIEGMERLDISFAAFNANPDETPPQSAFNMEAKFVGPCSTELVPGYENNHEDYYYNTAGGVDELHKQGLTGKGVTVAIIDSGLWEHELLRNDTSGKNRLLATYDAITDTEGGEALDESGHGTHMASIIANSGKTLKDGKWTGTYKGVAPDANLVAVKVLDRQGLAHLLDIVRGVQWVVDNKDTYGIRVMNISFAQDSARVYWEDPVALAALQAWASGIAVVASAGNKGPSPMSIGSPGTLPHLITVGAVTDYWTPQDIGDDYVPNFSSRGPTPSGHVKPDVVAPGGHITGLTHPSSQIARESPEDMLITGELVSTGSSQATAFTSAILALILESEPSLNPDELKCKLIQSAEPAISPSGLLAYSPLTQGYGYLKGYRAAVYPARDCQNEMDIGAELGGVARYFGPTYESEAGNFVIPRLERSIEPLSGNEKEVKKFWGIEEYIKGMNIQPNSLKIHTHPLLNWRARYNRETEIQNTVNRALHGTELSPR